MIDDLFKSTHEGKLKAHQNIVMRSNMVVALSAIFSVKQKEEKGI